MQHAQVAQLKGDGMSRVFLTMAIAYTAQQALTAGVPWVPRSSCDRSCWALLRIFEPPGWGHELDREHR